MADPTPNLIFPEDDGEELLLQPQQQQEEINRCTDSLLPHFSNLFSSATGTMATANQQSNSNNHCGHQSQCQCSPAKRSFSECHSESLRPDQEPRAKRQLLLNEHDDSIFALRGYSKIVLPSPEKQQSSSEWRCSSSSGLLPPPFSPTLGPLSRLVRTASDTSSVITSSVDESLNSCKNFVPYKPTLPPLDRTFSNSSSVIGVEGSPNSCKSFSPSPLPPRLPPTAMLPPRPPLRRTESDPTPAIMTNAQENPNSRRIRRVVDKMKEMSQLYEHMVREAEAEAEEQEEHNSSASEENIISQDVAEEADNDNEERVSVEEVGDCLCIQFKCPCGKGYKIIMSGNECYYKLK